MKILLASSDENLRDQLMRLLNHRPLTVDWARDGEEAWYELLTTPYDVLLTEAVLAGSDGLSLCRRLRDLGNPLQILLITTAESSEVLAEGLESGADACLSRPLQENLLLAHLRALTRGRGMRRATTSLSWGQLKLEPMARRITVQGQELKLNLKEYKILELFMSHPTQVFSQSDLSHRLWSLDEELPAEATIRSHLRSLRRKLEKAGCDELITTRYGHGYSLNQNLSPTSRAGLESTAPCDFCKQAITANFWREAMHANLRLQDELAYRQRLENQLRRSEALLRAAQKMGQIGCWEYDVVEGRTFWTDELFAIHGLTPKQSPPSREEALALIHPEDRDIHERDIRIPITKGEAFDTNLRIVRADDGEVRWINARGGPFFDDGGSLAKILGTTFDITCWVSGKRFLQEASGS